MGFGGPTRPYSAKAKTWGGPSGEPKKAQKQPLMNRALQRTVDPYGPEAMAFYQGILDSQAAADARPGGATYYEDPGPVVTQSLSSSPQWLEIDRQSDREIGQAKSDLKRRRAIINAERDRLLANLVPWGEQSREGIMGGFETRGLYGSGGMERDVARQRADEARRAAGFRSSAASQLSDAEAEVKSRIAAVNRARAIARADLVAQGFTA